MRDWVAEIQIGIGEALSTQGMASIQQSRVGCRGWKGEVLIAVAFSFLFLLSFLQPHQLPALERILWRSCEALILLTDAVQIVVLKVSSSIPSSYCSVFRPLLIYI